MARAKPLQGFTLVEMVLSMVVVSIIVLGIAGFVELGMKGYTQTVDRQRVQTQASFLIEKISREVRHAVPNSVQVTSGSNPCLSFYPIQFSGFYSLSAANPTSLSFVVGQTPPASYSGYSMIINPTSQSEFSGTNSTAIALSGADRTISLSSPLASESIAQRHYIFSDRVEYCFNLSTSRADRNSIQVADGLASGSFSYEPLSHQRGGIVHLSVSFEQNGEVSSYEQDIPIYNVP